MYIQIEPKPKAFLNFYLLACDKKAGWRVKKAAFEEILKEEVGPNDGESVIIMTGSKPSETELQTVEKLTKSYKYYIVFPNDGLINEIKRLTKESGKKRNDIFIIDKKTFKTIAVDIKTCGDPSPETIIAHLSEGVNQASCLILDITGKIDKKKLIKGLRGGWSKGLKFLFLNYHGQWYLIDKAKVFHRNWLIKNVR